MAVIAGIVGALALAIVFVVLRDRWQRWWFELELGLLFGGVL